MGNAKELYNKICRESGKKELSGTDLLHLQKVLLNAYVDIQTACDRNGVNIMLGGGSCLGAIRHKGFIPWDDDFDCMMSRDDFEQFKRFFEAELGSKYALSAPNYSENTYRFPRVFIKGTKVLEETDQHDIELQGSPICVDIFILENIPASRIIRLFKGAFASFLMLVASSVQEHNNSKSKKSIYLQTKAGRVHYKRRMFLGKLFSFKKLQFWMNAVDRSCKYTKETELLGIPTGRKHYFGEILSREVFFPITKVVFEGKEVNVPGGWDKYLTNLYGEYMIIPPPEKREKHYIAGIDFGGY